MQRKLTSELSGAPRDVDENEAACRRGRSDAGLAFTSFENQTEVVGRHLDSLGQYESDASSNV